MFSHANNITIRTSKIIIIDKQDKQDLIKILVIMVKKSLQSDKESNGTMISPKILICHFPGSWRFGGSVPDDGLGFFYFFSPVLASLLFFHLRCLQQIMFSKIVKFQNTKN